MIAQLAASRSTVRDYVALTKPRIISLLLLTALGGMVLAEQGMPAASLVLLVLGCGSMAAGGAHALNHYLERDIDGLMTRTRDRPVAGGRVSPREALAFGIVLNVIAFTLLSALVNPLSGLLAVSATVIYIFVDTLALKRTTPQNIVIGGAAGAFPPLVGWAAVTGSLSLPALYLFAIIFFWTPPHFWALALLLKDDYARAGVPMLPVVSGVGQTKRSILLYSFVLVALTLMFFTTQAVGWVYFVSALPLGAVLIHFSWRLHRLPDTEGARAAYLFSLLYMALLFGAIMADSLVDL